MGRKADLAPRLLPQSSGARQQPSGRGDHLLQGTSRPACKKAGKTRIIAPCQLKANQLVSNSTARRWQRECDSSTGFIRLISATESSLPDLNRPLFIRPSMRRFSIPLSLGGDPSLISALGMGRTVLKQNVAVLHAFWPRIISSETHPAFRGRESFELARSVLDIDVQAEEMDILDLSPNSVGTFDVVLLLGFYHLLDPIAVLQQIATLTREVLIVETTPTLWR